MGKENDRFGTRAFLDTRGGRVLIHRLNALERQGIGNVDRLPYSIKVLLEAAIRQCDGFEITEDDVLRLARWNPAGVTPEEIPFKPARVILQDFTGVPAVVDLAALRSAMHRLGGDPAAINPQIPVDLVIDHSVQVDRAATPEALAENMRIEFQRNRERYEFLRWGQHAFDDFRVVPPGMGIIHQVNLEYLAPVVHTRTVAGQTVAFPDSLVGTDSHTTMINGLGVLGWGVGGIEAEAVMLGQPIYMLMPEVIGFRLEGELPEGATATDLVLTCTQMLRARGVVGKFVEFYGEGVARLSLPDRATIANMAPEYGATMGFFPIDDETLRFLRQTGRSEELVDLVERYTKEVGLFASPGGHEPHFVDTLSLDLSTVEPSLAGPKRPQDRIPLREMKSSFHTVARSLEKDLETQPSVPVVLPDGRKSALTHGSVVIAAITSCTNTSNPSVMIGAGILAQKAVQRGLSVPAHVKTSLAPGSRVVTRYLEGGGLLPALEALGFYVVGYGCTTCIGNSGPLSPPIDRAVRENDLLVAAVLSGNRNFEGRVHPLTRANYLASPPLVVAYALAGTVDIDFSTEPIGKDESGQPVFLRDIWPTQEEIRQGVASALDPERFRTEYANVFSGNRTWNEIEIPEGKLYTWNSASTYIQEPPFFTELTVEEPDIEEIRGARVLALLGDSVTTDHISPAGAIPKESPAGRYLIEHGVQPEDFNSFGSRRGNHEVMMRGTFGNIRLRNRLVPGTEGGYTLYLPEGARGPDDGEPMSIYDAAMKYRAHKRPLIVLAGKEYGTGSSRDWAAKGTILLGVRAVVAESFERIHRSNLVGMGVLPLEFKPGENVETLGLTGFETFDILGLDNTLSPRQEVTLRVTDGGGKSRTFQAICRIDTPVEIKYYRNGGILHAVLRDILRKEGR